MELHLVGVSAPVHRGVCEHDSRVWAGGGSNHVVAKPRPLRPTPAAGSRHEADHVFADPSCGRRPPSPSWCPSICFHYADVLLRT